MNDFEDFPECFQQNDWKVTFFHNEVISKIVHKQLNLQVLEQLLQRRSQYVQRVNEIQSKTEQAKNEILKNI